jgi:hypothetical protein
MSESSSEDESTNVAPVKGKGKQSMKSSKKGSKDTANSKGLDNRQSTSKDDNSNVVYPDEYEFDSSDEEVCATVTLSFEVQYF